MIGRLDIETEQRLVSETKQWLEERREECPAYAHYLDHWGDWVPPGTEAVVETDTEEVSGSDAARGGA